MSAVATLKILDALITGMSLVTETNKAMQQVVLTIQAAQTEGRDLTDAEINAARKSTDNAIAALQSAERYEDS